MGVRIRESSDEETTVSPPLVEALLFTTMCIIGLPVDVHIKDGSIYSGIFHTACVDKDYGIILKKARLVRKGACDTNVVNGGVIDTLVVLPGDLVQVVAEGVMLPADGISNDVAYDEVGAVEGTGNSFEFSENEARSVESRVDKDQLNPKRQVGVSRLQGEGNGCHKSDSFKGEPVREVQGSCTSLDGCHAQLEAVKESHAMITSTQLPNGRDMDNGASTNDKFIDDFHDNLTSAANPTQMVAPQHSVSKRSAKDSKLNPGAKIFLPASMNIRSASPPAVPTVASMAYVPNNFAAVPIASSLPEVGIQPIAPLSSWPVKLAPHGNLTAANGGSGIQYTQPVQISGHFANRAQPVRYSGQYQHIQAGPTYVLPSPQNGMVGRLGQLVYVHPVTHGAATLAHASHSLLTSHPIHLPKHEGLAAVEPPLPSSTPPLAVTGQPPIPVMSHIQLSQPHFPAIHPITVLGSHGPYSAKFP
ncbi:hypothetical protein Nepgr_007578 [Nepenthes gracilis]|uniref:Ataxin 2 SM domain-containing protein n=1 Tax=Nepenthes gracilis TaxID=150966 RepID=A0AAD3S7A1_NEPGR|nr:hypothetical protein Nepgr_007578 [Nepenthes gracilis]